MTLVEFVRARLAGPLAFVVVLLAGCPSTPAGADPQFGSCAEATAAGYGPYERGDGTVCE